MHVKVDYLKAGYEGVQRAAASKLCEIHVLQKLICLLLHLVYRFHYVRHCMYIWICVCMYT